MDASHVVDQQLEAFAGFIEASPHNLVSKRGLQELRTRHLPECAALAKLLPSGGQRVLDVGSGGGLPGIVLAIVRPELEVHLLDSTQKKTRFLEMVGEELGLSLMVHRGRAEVVARSPLAGSFDVVTARAVAPLDQLVPWTVPFLRVGGLLYAVKGERWREELEVASSGLSRSGARLVATPEETGGSDTMEYAPRIVIIARDR